MDSQYDVAIVGMSGEFPGAKSVKAFWDNLVAEKETLSRLTEAELQAAHVPASTYTRAEYVPVAGMLNDIDLFAAEFFGYSPRDASLMDPQHRKMLEHAWHALEDAGINPHDHAGLIGVFVGSSLNTYLLNNILSHPNAHESPDIQQILFGNGPDYLATRIAYLLNLRGAAINIQTACSTSLVAIHEACQHLISFQVDVALAGGVSIAAPQGKGYSYSVDGMLSPDGHCRPFSDEAQGTVFSSGLGLVVLKRLADAERDGDAIYAVIKGSAINNDGREKVGYTAPSVDGQAQVIALAQMISGIKVSDIQYIETHGTATALGDPVEVSALQSVFGQSGKKQFCALGSLKSNIGHLDVAAGVAGLMKTALSLYHQKIPASLHVNKPSKKIDWEKTAFYVNQTTKDWPHSERGARYAGVSSFGIGGTNAHVILGEYQPFSTQTSVPALLVFSAKTETELAVRLDQFADYAKANPHLNLAGAARSLHEGRVEFRYRAAFVAANIAEVIAIIQQKTYASALCQHAGESVQPKVITQCTQADLQQLMQQWLAGAKIDWKPHYAETGIIKERLPLYPFTRSRHWIEPYQSNQVDPNHKLPMDQWFYMPAWRKCQLTAAGILPQNGRLLIWLPEHSAFDWILGAAAPLPVIIVRQGHTYQQHSDDHYSLNLADEMQYERLLQSLIDLKRIPTHCIHALTLTLSWKATSVGEFDQHQTNGLLNLIYFMKAFEKMLPMQSLHLTVITNRLNSIGQGDRVEPHKAPLISAVKVIPKELPRVQTQLIDIDAVDYPQFIDYQQQQLTHEIFQPLYLEEEILYRGRQRWLREYVSTPIARVTSRAVAAAQGKLILITGGLGQLGLDIADYFSTEPGCQVALLARTAIPPLNEWQNVIAAHDADHPLVMMLQRITAMRERGANVHVFQADVGNADMLRRAITDIESTMGAITGVVHAAGETVNGIISLKSADSLQESYQAKVYGTYHLCEALLHKKLDFFILCSSMNAIIGGLGQLDNTAANAFIDYMAEYMTAQYAMPVFAINWGAVNVNRPMKVNVLHQFMDLSAEHKKNRMNDDEVNEVYDRLLTVLPSSRVVISTIDMNVVLKTWNRVASVEELAKDREGYQQNVLRILQKQEMPQSMMQQWVAERWQQLLGVNEVGLNDNFFELGGHSLAAVQLMTKIKDEFNIKIHVMTLYELPTLQAFSDYLDHQTRNTKLKMGNKNEI